MYGKEYLEEMEAQKCYQEMREALEAVETRYDSAVVVKAKRLVAGHFPTNVAPIGNSLAALQRQQLASAQANMSGGLFDGFGSFLQ